MFYVLCSIVYSFIVDGTFHRRAKHKRRTTKTNMENKFIPDAIEIVKEAIEFDQKEEYEKALNLYRDALARFTMGLKYEKNDARKALILQRVEGYMKRAEELRDYIQLQNGSNGGGLAGSGTSVTASRKQNDPKNNNNNNEPEEERTKLRNALSSAIVTEKPNVRWDDISGLEAAKEALKETVILPVRFPQLFTGNRRPFKGILLYGPPGTGKSYLAKAVATEADGTFFSVSSSDLVSKWQGESERLVRSLFELAREADRAIVFIDEIDSLCGSRSEGEADSSRRIKTEFLVQMDGVGHSSKDVLVLGATNVPWELDSAIRRRFEKRVYIPLPNREARSLMIKMNLGNDEATHSLSEQDLDRLGEITEGASGSDLKVLVKEALMQPLRTCQKAQQFIPIERGQFLIPCDKYPNCPRCPPKLSTDRPDKDYTCRYCGAIRMQLWDVPSEKLKAPPITIRDFEKALTHSVSSVSPEDLQRYEEWTQKFGQEGS